jgi:restriction endonuclease Mrr
MTRPHSPALDIDVFSFLGSPVVVVPDFQSLMQPCLVVHRDSQPHTSADLRDRLATLMHVSEENHAVPLASSTVPAYTTRVAWAVTHLAQASFAVAAAHHRCRG